jgi:hypothetical protein
MEGLWKGPLAIVGAILGLAILAVILGKNSQTSAVIGQASSGLSQIITSAVTLNVTAGATNAPQQAIQMPSIGSATGLLAGLTGG